MIRVGPAGWTYKDWEGIVYPERRPKVDQLAYLAERFDTIEINSTFYRPASPKTAESWLRRTAFNPEFKFTAKVLEAFTHEKRVDDESLMREWKEGIKPLSEAGRLGAVLIQFPWSFKNEPPSREYLLKVIERFSDSNPVIEFRHASWDDEEVMEFLKHFKAAICNIDQPVIGRSMRARCYVTAPPGYFRFHGRNYRDWFREDAGRDARYNYLYKPEQIEVHQELVEQAAAEQEGDTYAVYNNHFRGQAIVNAIQLRKRLKQKVIEIPENLPAAYPDAGLGE